MKKLNLSVRWVYEHRYNSYLHVDETKKRPVLVWCNKSRYLNHKIFCFYCSTKPDKANPRSCVKIESYKNPSFKKDTYVWIHRPILVENKDLITNSWKHIKDSATKDLISLKVDEVYTDLLIINKV